MSRARELSRLGNPNIISSDNDYNVGFGTLTPRAKGDFVGVVSATSFYGDGSSLTGVAAAGIGTALSAEKTNPLNNLFYTNQTYTVGVSTTIDPPTSGSLGYSQASDIEVADGVDLTVADGDVFMVDVLGITTDPQVGASVDNNYLFSTVYADNITNQAGTGAPDASQGFKISKTTESTNSITGALIVSGGVGIAKSLHVGGNVSVGGTLTYEDVTNVDVIGLATYRSGAQFGVAGVGGTITGAGNATITGIVTASGFKGSGANLTALNADNISSGIVTSARLGGGTANATTFLNGAGQFAAAGGGGTEAYFYMGGAGQALTSATWARVACNTAYQDSVSGCDVSTNNGRYTIQTGHAGRYYFIGQCSTFANGNNITRADVKIYKNGSVFAGAYQHVISGGSGYARHVGPQIATMDNAVVGDYYELWVVVSGTTVSLSMDGQTSKSNYFMGWKIAD